MKYMRRYFVSALFAVLLIIPIGLQSAQATTWYPGEGLKQGDYFRYSVCWIDFHNCAPLEIDFWVKNQTSDGSGWNLEFLAIDGTIVQKGTVTIGMTTPDPTYPDPNVADYANVYKNTISWLDAFATKDSPKDFSYPAWGRSASVGGQSVGPTGQADVTVHAGSYKAWIIGWHKGVDNMIWVVPNLPFPVRAQVYTDVTNGVPPPDYTLELLQTGNSSTEPKFLQVNSTGLNGTNPDCPVPDMQNDAVHDAKTTDSGSVTVDYRYSPSFPHQGCPIEWRISFEKNFDITQKYSAVHYDIFTVDQNGVKLGSVAQDRGWSDLFAPVGDDDRTIPMKQPPPVTHVVIAVLGTGPQGSLTDTSLSGTIQVDVKTAEPIPEFPVTVFLIMAVVIAIGILFTRFRSGLSIKF